MREHAEQKNHQLLKIALPLLIAVLAIWLFFTPHLAFRGMRAAAEARDAEKLSSYINYPVLKENLKASFNAKLLGQAQKQPSDNPFANLGIAMASLVIGPMVDAFVTPQAMAEMMKGEKPRLIKSPGAADGATSGSSGEQRPERPKTSMRYEDFNRFVISLSSMKSLKPSHWHSCSSAKVWPAGNSPPFVCPDAARAARTNKKNRLDLS